MAVTRTWKVYGADGHRQRESFNKSHKHDFSACGITQIIDVQNSDKTGSNDYTIVSITRDTAEECEEEMRGQISDGIFENCCVGKVKEVITTRFTNREVIIKNGKTFSIMQFAKAKPEKWNLIWEYHEPAGNRVFNSRAECLAWIEQNA